MSTSAANFFINVQTWIPDELALLRNLHCAIATFNKEISSPADYPANLGDTVNLQIPPRPRSGTGLVATMHGVEQLLHPFVIDQAAHSAYPHNAQQYIFNLEKNKYLEKVAKSEIADLAEQVEANLLTMANSSCPVMTLNEDNQSVPTGALHVESGPFRCFGDGRTAINSFQQLAQLDKNFKNFGVAPGRRQLYLPDIYIPAIIGSGLSQFTPKRGDETSQTWELGSFSGSPDVDCYTSNYLPTQVAGDVGKTNKLLTVVGTTLDSNGNVIAIEFSGAGTSISKSLRAGDILTFQDGVSGFSNMRFMQYTGNIVSQQPVQMRVQNDVDSDGSGHVEVAIIPGLAVGQTSSMAQKINQTIQAGMQVRSTADHVCGLLVSGKAAYFSSPKLPDTSPFHSASERDEETGLSLRVYYADIPFKNTRGYVHDLIWSSTGIPHYMERVAFPVSL